MPSKTFKTRIQNKTDTKTNWDKATNFVPLSGETIVYSAETGKNNAAKLKMGDGTTKVKDLPFATLTASEINENIIKDPNKTYIVWEDSTFPNSRDAEEASFTAPDNLVIDWGDGTIESIATTVTSIPKHTYTDGQSYHLITMSGLTTIGSSMFFGCGGLRSIVVGDSVTSIGTGAFQECGSLKSAIISDYVTTIGAGAFEECIGLESVTLGRRMSLIDSQVFLNCEGLTNIEIPSGVETISTRSFMGCSGLKDLVIPTSVSSIGEEAFGGCSGLTSLTLPFIGENRTVGEGYNRVLGFIFGYVTATSSSEVSGATMQYSSGSTYYHYYIPSNLKTVVINGSISSLNNYAFRNCTRLTNVILPDALTSIGNHAFNSCFRLTNIVIPSAVTTIGSSAFYGSGLEEITIPSNVTTIGYSAFSFCNSLANVVMGQSISTTAKTISSNVFSYCYSLSNVTLPDNITSIPDLMFDNCRELARITIPRRVTSIGSSAFYGCYNLADVTIPNATTTIKGYAFGGCYNLTSLTIPVGVTTIMDYAFSGSSNLETLILKPTTVPTLGANSSIPTTIKKIVVPKESIDAYKAATNWSKYADKMVYELDSSDLSSLFTYIDNTLTINV